MCKKWDQNQWLDEVYDKLLYLNIYKNKYKSSEYLSRSLIYLDYKLNGALCMFIVTLWWIVIE